MSREELRRFIDDEENGLKKTSLMNGIEVSATFRPTDLWVYQELSDRVATKYDIDSLRRKYGKGLYFIVDFSKDGKEALNSLGGGPAQFSNVMQTLSFRMPQYTTLTTSEQDTIPVSDFMSNRTFGMSSATEVVFVFDAEAAKQAEWLQLNVNEFGMNIGNQRFRFKLDDLRNVPEIDFELK